MPAPATIDAFLEVLGKSGLVEVERLHLFRQQAAGISTTPRKLAARLVASGLVTEFQAEQLLLGKHRGFTIGKYKVLERIGTGGHSTVYLCEHLVVKRRVAIKVLPTAKADNPAALARFYREARAAGALDHCNLVKAHDIDQDNGLHFYIMDYVDGSSLQEIVSRRGPLPIERAAHYIRMAAHGLQAAFAAGLVHRDIKPANIMLDRGGGVRVLDLGLARFFSDDSDPLTLKYDNNNVLGTADYVAPEQALNSHEVDIRADIYGLGGTFYFLLAGQPLFPDGQITQKLIWHQTRRPTPLRELRPEVPAELAAVVERMIQKNPAQRYQTPAEVIDALIPWTTEPVSPPEAAEMPRLSPAARAAVVAAAESGSNIPRGPQSDGSSPRSGPGRGGVALARPVQRSATRAEPATTPLVAAHHDTAPAGIAPPVAVPLTEAAPVHASLQLAAATKSVLVPAGRRLFATVLFLTTASLTGMGIHWVLHRNGPKTEPIAANAATRIVSHSPGHFASVAAALREAPPDAHILICEPTWEEAVQFNGDGSPAHAVHIEGKSPTGAAVHWRPPPSHPADQPLIRISEGASLTLQGFTLDGEDRIKDLLALFGPSAGMTLEDMHLRGFQQNGIVLRHCTGTSNRPVTLQRLRITPARAAASALRFEAQQGENNRHIRVLDCRLEGPYREAVSFHGSATDIEQRGNRISNAVDGR